jgi:hypothetical protein
VRTSAQHSILLHNVSQNLPNTVVLYESKCSSFAAFDADDRHKHVCYASWIKKSLGDVSNLAPFSSSCQHVFCILSYCMEWKLLFENFLPASCHPMWNKYIRKFLSLRHLLYKPR